MSEPKDDITNLLNDAAKGFELPYNDQYWKQFKQLQQTQLPSQNGKGGRMAKLLGNNYLSIIVGTIIVAATALLTYLFINHSSEEKTPALAKLTITQPVSNVLKSPDNKKEIIPIQTTNNITASKLISAGPAITNNAHATLEKYSGEVKSLPKEQLTDTPNEKPVYKKVIIYYKTKSATHPLSKPVWVRKHKPLEKHTNFSSPNTSLAKRTTLNSKRVTILTKAAVENKTTKLPANNKNETQYNAVAPSYNNRIAAHPSSAPIKKLKIAVNSANKATIISQNKTTIPKNSNNIHISAQTKVSFVSKTVAKTTTKPVAVLVQHGSSSVTGNRLSSPPLLALAEKKQKKTSLGKNNIKSTTKDKQIASSAILLKTVHPLPARLKKRSPIASVFGKKRYSQQFNTIGNKIWATIDKNNATPSSSSTLDALQNTNNPTIKSTSVGINENNTSIVTDEKHTDVVSTVTPTLINNKADTAAGLNSLPPANKADSITQKEVKGPVLPADTSHADKTQLTVVDKTAVVKTLSLAVIVGEAFYQSMSADNALQANTFNDKAYSPNFFIGAQIDYRFSKYFSLYSHLVYQQRGSTHLSITATQATYDFSRTDQDYSLQIEKLHYLEMPIALGIQLAENHRLFLGAGAAFLFNTTTQWKGFSDSGPSTQYGYSNGLNILNYYATAGYYWNLPYHLRANINFEYYLNPAIDKQYFKNLGNTSNNNIKIGLSYRFK